LLGGIFIKIKSRITGEIYEGDDSVFLMNTLQAGMYIKNNAELVDCFWHDTRNSLCFVFNRINTYELYDAWCKHELK
jgi:hypothetical protein